MVEWSILSLVVLALMWVFARQAQLVRGQAERAAVKLTLGAIRTALVIEHLRTQTAPAQPGSAAASVYNPFMLLQNVPVNFAGEFSMSNIYLAPAGTWVFDPQCVCIGYRLLYPEWLEQPINGEAVWFRIAAPSGPLQVTALDRYVWQGDVVN